MPPVTRVLVVAFRLIDLSGAVMRTESHIDRRTGKQTRQRPRFESLEPRTFLSGTIYVDSTSSGSGLDGSSWASAYPDLQQALAAAGSGDKIRVAGGTYRPTAGTDRVATFQLESGVSLRGGYAGRGAANPNTRDVVTYPSILSGDIGVAGDASDNSYHVVTGRKAKYW